jgi:hypothetical protein
MCIIKAFIPLKIKKNKIEQQKIILQRKGERHLLDPRPLLQEAVKRKEKKGKV